LFSNPSVLYIAGGVLGLIGIIPGMPHVAFLLLAACLAAVGWMIQQRQEQQAQEAAQQAVAATAPVAEAASAEASWDDVALVDPLGLEVGYRLIPLVDTSQQGDLLQRIRSLRKKFAQDVGFLPPVVHIRDNLELKPTEYRILLAGVEIGRGEAMPGLWLAIDPGGVTETLDGVATTDPAFGLPAVWIEESLRDRAQMAGYTVVDPGTVAATHLNHLLHRYSSELLGRQEVQQLLDRIGREAPKLVEDFVPKTVSLSTLQKVLQGLLQEDVPIRDMRTIIDVLAEHVPRLNTNGATVEPSDLVALVRRALGRAITQNLFPGAGEMRVIGLDVGLERVLLQAVNAGGALEPGLADTLLREAEAAVQHQEQSGDPAVLMVQAPLRASLARFLRLHLPHLAVLASSEIPDDRTIRVTAMIGGKTR
ncbi:MAG: FHIPEP family type III secretion protein, partial [Pigmentiphaga sp.]